MNSLVTYYMFLIACGVLMVVLRNSPMVQNKRELCVSFLLAPPLILGLQQLNLGFVVGVVVTYTLFALFNRYSPNFYSQETNPVTYRMWIATWLTEATVPLLIHFAFRGNQQIESGALLILGALLLVGTFVAFMVFAPDLEKNAHS